MVRYREKPKIVHTIDVVEWTGENLEEVKEFLGDSFIAVDEGTNSLWFAPYKDCSYYDYAEPNSDVLVKYEDGNKNFDSMEKWVLEKDWYVIL